MAKGHVTGQMLFRAVRFAIARQLKVMGFKADADTDPLTGMPNRRHLESQFVELHAATKQNNEPLTLALFDIDHFKLVNDEHGHFIGDAVLKEIARLFQSSIEDGMLASRFGGEEFALLMPGSDIERAARLLKVSSTNKQNSDETWLTIPITASAGLIAVEDEESWGSLHRVR